ncbi:MAG: HAMP domain-containing sensor histidine kinase [Polyangiales bacterium]
MARRRNLPSVAVPIIFGAATVPVTAALLVGWIVLLGRRIAQEELAGDVWLLVLGTIAFAAIITILVLFSYFLYREIREVRRQDSFIDSVTHELKSPLASIKLCLETLGRPELAAEQRQKLRDMMIHDVERLSGFIDDVLQASRLAHEAATINLSDVDLAELARSIAATVAGRHRLREEAIRLEIPRGLVLTSDRPALELVLRNLLDNAVKYSNDPVTVTVRAFLEPKRGHLVLEVTDRGIGIERENLKRIFDRFYRVDHESVRRRKGTGLGLFVVSSLVRNLGGRITAHSEGVGHGTTMRVILPRAAAAQPAAPSE